MLSVLTTFFNRGLNRSIEARVPEAFLDLFFGKLFRKNKQPVVIQPKFEAEFKPAEKLSNGAGVVRLKIELCQFA